MVKRGQITIFIIAALLILFSIGFLLMSSQKESYPSSRTITESAVFSYVNSCIDQQVKQGTTYFGLGPLSGYQIADYLNNNLADCADFSVIKQQGVKVTTKQVASKVDIYDRAIDVEVTFPIVLEAPDFTLSFNKFDYSLSRVTQIGEKQVFATGAVVAFEAVAAGDIPKASSDKRAELNIPEGTKYTGTGELKMEEKNVNGLSNEIVVGNKLYRISDINFAPIAEITMRYEENDVPRNYEPDMLSIAWFDEPSDIWVSVPSTTNKQLRTVTGRISRAGLYGIVVNCKPLAVPQVNFTNWIFREQVYSADRTLLNPLWDETGKSPAVFALKEHKQLKLSGGSGWNDAAARIQIGVPKGSAAVKDWDADDQLENDAACPDCTKEQEKCRTICQDEAKTKYQQNGWKPVQSSSEYLSFSKDGIKDGTISKCSKKECGAYSCPTAAEPSRQCTDYCPDKCVDITQATPNNYGYDDVEKVGGSGKFDYRLQVRGNSCYDEQNALKIDFKPYSQPLAAGGFCNDLCRAKLNSKDVNVDYSYVQGIQLKGGLNLFEIDVINRKDSASYARGHIDLVAGTGSYLKCEQGKEIKTNCVCGVNNVNVLDDVKKEQGDYGEWDIEVKSKKFCCGDGSVVDDIAKCSVSACPTEKDKVVLEAKNTGCACGSSVYDYNRDGPGYCCSEQTCEGTKCTKGQAFASGKKAENDLNPHEYVLEYKSGSYSVYMDGKLLKTAQSAQRPSQLKFGNDLRPSAAPGTWTALKVDSIRVVDGAGKEFFIDEFNGNGIDASKWIVDKGDGSVDVSNGAIELKSSDTQFINKFPFVRTSDSVKIVPETGDFKLTVKMQYPKVTGHGTYFWVSPGILTIGQDDSAPGGTAYGLWRLRLLLLGDMIYSCGSVGGCGTKTCQPASIPSPQFIGNSEQLGIVQGCEKPGKFGAHTMLQDYPVSEFGKQLDKVKALVGDCGFVKNLVVDVGYSLDVKKWSAFVSEAKSRNLIPVLRLQGRFVGSSWEKPDSSADYSVIAGKYVEFIRMVESDSKAKISYVEIWNEPNVASEWGGTANPEEYGKFLLAVSKAIREYDLRDGKKDINVMNGAISVRSDTSNGNYQTQAFISGMFEKSPELKNYIDIWAVHPYPPEQAQYKEQVQRIGLSSQIPVMITETSWGRCNDDSCSSFNRILSPSQFVDSYRNIWLQDSNVIAVIPFGFVSPDSKWANFNLVNPTTLEGNEYYSAIKDYRESLK